MGADDFHRFEELLARHLGPTAAFRSADQVVQRNDADQSILVIDHGKAPHAFLLERTERRLDVIELRHVLEAIGTTLERFVSRLD